MGFIKAFAGALGGTLADQWKDYYRVVSSCAFSWESTGLE
jgi:hypothetical protein